jgi:outer membrane murein-binding lipoprotein Lpp
MVFSIQQKKPKSISLNTPIYQIKIRGEKYTKYTSVAVIMSAVLAVLFVAGCTSNPDKVSCPISPEISTSNQSEVASPIKQTETYAQEPCIGINSNSSQNEDSGEGV